LPEISASVRGGSNASIQNTMRVSRAEREWSQANLVVKAGVAGQTGDSGEAERSFRRENERHSSMIPNTIGAQRRWLFECARKVFGFVKKTFPERAAL
jgi:hypothetical protein